MLRVCRVRFNHVNHVAQRFPRIPAGNRHLNSAAGTPVAYEYSSSRVSSITLNASKNRNALSSEMMTAISDAIARAIKDHAKVIILQAVGPAFSAGHDLKELQQLQKAGSKEGAAIIFKQCSDLMQMIVDCPVPTIAAVHAVATAAGCQLAASCDIVLAAKQATFATPGVNIGLFCSTPAVALSRAVNTKKSAEMLFTGLPQSAADMQAAGLVNRIVDGDVQEAAKEMAEIIAQKPTRVIQLGKRAFRAQLRAASLADAYEMASQTMCSNLLDEPDTVEGIDAFIAKRHPNFS